LRTKVTERPGSRAAGIAMAYKLIAAARAVGALSTPHTWSPWCAPTTCFTKGKPLERPADITAPNSTESADAEVA
jgi:putative transposase